MLSEKEFRDKNEEVYKIYFPKNSYAQMKSGEDTHFMSCDEESEDNFIEITADGISDLIEQTGIVLRQSVSDKSKEISRRIGETR